MTALRCQVLGPETAALSVILLHGYGAPGDDLVGLAPELGRIRPRLKTETRWFFPEGPLRIPEGGPDARAWWPIDMERQQQAMFEGEAARDSFRQEKPAGLDAARAAVTALTDAVRRQLPPDGQWVLGGFSQGAMLSTDLALQGFERESGPDGLLLFSGTLTNATEWRSYPTARRGIRVFQSHGTSDPLLPFADAEKVRDLLMSAGHHVEFVSFDGGHTIPRIALEGAAALLDGLLE